eukprot:SAG25_NODE_306_length_10078_cov_13.534923_4_plen_110_part_00
MDAAYLKSDLRGNKEKMGPRWSRTVYRIKSVKATTGAGLPEYRVEAVSDVYPGDKDDPTIWYAHNRVQRILEPTEPPADKVREEPTYKEQPTAPTVDGRKYWMDFPFSE